MLKSIQKLQSDELRAFLIKLDPGGLIRNGNYKTIVVWDYSIPELVSRFRLNSDCIVAALELIKQDSTLSIEQDKFENSENHLMDLVQMKLLENTQPMVFEIQPELRELLKTLS